MKPKFYWSRMVRAQPQTVMVLSANAAASFHSAAVFVLVMVCSSLLRLNKV